MVNDMEITHQRLLVSMLIYILRVFVDLYCKISFASQSVYVCVLQVMTEKAGSILLS